MKFSIIGMSIAILIEVLVTINFVYWHQQSSYEFNQHQLEIQVNYAVDAAVQEMLYNTADIGSDYSKWGNIKVDPEVAYNTYCAILLRNLGWSDNEENREYLESYAIPFFCVAGYDGYYMMQRQEKQVSTTGTNITTQKTYPLMWSMKIPYSYVGTDGTIFGVTLGYDNVISFRNTVVNMSEEYKVNGGVQYGLSDSVQRGIVSSTLSEACTNALFAGLLGNTTIQLYIPSTMSEWSGSNSVEGPSVITYLAMDNGTLKYDSAIFGVGGARIEESNYCISYLKGGIKLYTYASNRSKVEALGLTIEQIYVSPESAAEAGYFFDLTYLQ